MPASFYRSSYAPTNSTLNRFDARFWHVDYPLSAIATVVSNTATDLVVNAEYRSNQDLVGVMWSSKDLYGHYLLQYETNNDYTGNFLAFTCDAARPWDLSATINNEAGGHIYRLYPYIISGSTLIPYTTSVGTQGAGPGVSYPVSKFFSGGFTIPSGQHVYIIPFSDLRTGYNFDGSVIDPTTITQLFLSLVTNSYQLGQSVTVSDGGGVSVSHITINNVLPSLKLLAGDTLTWTATLVGGAAYQASLTVTTWTGDGTSSRTLALAAPITFTTGGVAIANNLQLVSALGSEALQFNMNNVVCVGQSSVLARRYYLQPAHGMQMNSGFDDTYNITPWRQIQQTYDLGYRGIFNCYMGASHYFKAVSSYDGGGLFQNKLDTTASSPLNGPTVAWCTSLFSELFSRGFDFIWSSSYEILYSYMPTGWEQQDYLSNSALSGYTPPTSFIRPTKPDCLDYLVKVIKQGMSLLVSAGIALRFQIGEPWWWDGSYSNGRPCIYDLDTLNLYHTETGLFAPTSIHNIYQQPLTSSENAYCVWLGQKLGIATGYIRDQVKAAYPAALASLLFFSPQIFNTASVILPIINFPVTYWQYPNYDFTMIEDYDWVIAKQFNKLINTVQAATVTLGYPLNKVHYFIGFVLTSLDSEVWVSMSTAFNMALSSGITEYYVWAYPQVIRDSICFGSRPMPTVPSGLIFSIDVNYGAPKGADISTISGGISQTVLEFDRGPQIYSGKLELTKLKYFVWMLFLHRIIDLGTVTFLMPLDSGLGITLHKCNIIPGSHKIEHKGFNDIVASFQIEAEASIYD